MLDTFTEIFIEGNRIKNWINLLCIKLIILTKINKLIGLAFLIIVIHFLFKLHFLFFLFKKLKGTINFRFIEINMMHSETNDEYFYTEKFRNNGTHLFRQPQNKYNGLINHMKKILTNISTNYYCTDDNTQMGC